MKRCNICGRTDYSDGPPFCTVCGEGEMEEFNCGHPGDEDSCWLEMFPEIRKNVEEYDKRKELENRIAELEKENAKLNNENLAMRNCGNCANSDLCVGGTCNHDDDECLGFGTYEKWRYE